LYDRGVSRRVAYLLLIAAAAARLLIQAAAMPPYAGLDELYHVARLAFVLEEHRNPTTSEPSIPPDLEATLERRLGLTVLQRGEHSCGRESLVPNSVDFVSWFHANGLPLARQCQV